MSSCSPRCRRPASESASATPIKAEDLADRGVRVRAGSFTEPESLAYAFEGASQVLIVSVDKLGDEAVDLHRAAIDPTLTE